MTHIKLTKPQKFLCFAFLAVIFAGINAANTRDYENAQKSVRNEFQMLARLNIRYEDKKALSEALKHDFERSMSPAEYIRYKFGEKAAIATAVFMAESHLRPSAVGDKHLAYYKDGVKYGESYGIAQIRYLPGRPAPEKLLDPKFNIDYAYEVSKQGTTFLAWSAYKSEKYKKYL